MHRGAVQMLGRTGSVRRARDPIPPGAPTFSTAYEPGLTGSGFGPPAGPPGFRKQGAAALHAVGAKRLFLDGLQTQAEIDAINKEVADYERRNPDGPTAFIIERVSYNNA
jgi:hypothetical protein